MKKKLLILVIVLLLASSIFAQTRVFEFLVNQNGFMKSDTTSGEIFFAPKGARFQILDETKDEFIIRFTELSENTLNEKVQGFIGETYLLKELPKDLSVEVDVNYKIGITNLPRYNYKLLFGFDWGGLSVPFKYQTIDGTLSTGSSIGTYIGWKQRWIGIQSTLVLSAGLSIIPTQNVNTTSVETKTGLTLAVGIIFTPASQLQIGLITGFDHTGSSNDDKYPYEDKPWVSFAIGFGFIK